MDLCIKTGSVQLHFDEEHSFNPCFNGSMYKNSIEKKDKCKSC